MSTCLGKSHQKSIQHSIDKPYYDRMHERVQNRKGKRMKKLRQSTVEPVLGTLINFLGMKRVNTRGIIQANKHVLMASIAYNLKKYMNYSKRNRNCMAMAKNKAIVNQIVLAFNRLLLTIKFVRAIDSHRIEIVPVFYNAKMRADIFSSHFCIF